MVSSEQSVRAYKKQGAFEQQRALAQKMTKVLVVVAAAAAIAAAAIAMVRKFHLMMAEEMSGTLQLLASVCWIMSNMVSQQYLRTRNSQRRVVNNFTN